MHASISKTLPIWTTKVRFTQNNDKKLANRKSCKRRKKWPGKLKEDYRAFRVWKLPLVPPFYSHIFYFWKIFHLHILIQNQNTQSTRLSSYRIESDYFAFCCRCLHWKGIGFWFCALFINHHQTTNVYFRFVLGNKNYISQSGGGAFVLATCASAHKSNEGSYYAHFKLLRPRSFITSLLMGPLFNTHLLQAYRQGPPDTSYSIGPQAAALRAIIDTKGVKEFIRWLNPVFFLHSSKIIRDLEDFGVQFCRRFFLLTNYRRKFEIHVGWCVLHEKKII